VLGIEGSGLAGRLFLEDWFGWNADGEQGVTRTGASAMPSRVKRTGFAGVKFVSHPCGSIDWFCS
jgi:hypothetical protein